MSNDISLVQAQRVLKMIADSGIKAGQLDLCISGGWLEDLLEAVNEGKAFDRDGFRRFCGLKPLVEYAYFLVDHSRSLAELIKQGNFDKVHDDICNGLFPLNSYEGVIEYQPCVFCFNVKMSTPDIVNYIKKADHDNPWQPAEFTHLVAFGANDANLQHLPIIALGSEIDEQNCKCAPCIQVSKNGYSLTPYYWSGVGKWEPRFRFLAVRKVVKVP